MSKESVVNLLKSMHKENKDDIRELRNDVSSGFTEVNSRLTKGTGKIATNRANILMLKWVIGGFGVFLVFIASTLVKIVFMG